MNAIPNYQFKVLLALLESKGILSKRASKVIISVSDLIQFLISRNVLTKEELTTFSDSLVSLSLDSIRSQDISPVVKFLECNLKLSASSINLLKEDLITRIKND